MVTHELQGYVLVLDKIVHVTRVFEAMNAEGFQFNVRMLGPTLIELKYPDRATAVLQRDLLVEAIEAA